MIVVAKSPARRVDSDGMSSSALSRHVVKSRAHAGVADARAHVVGVGVGETLHLHASKLVVLAPPLAAERSIAPKPPLPPSSRSAVRTCAHHELYIFVTSCEHVLLIKCIRSCEREGEGSSAGLCETSALKMARPGE